MNNDLTILGKFKSVKALKDAYDALQREFTKKCQKLSLLSKKSEENLLQDGGQSEETLSVQNVLKSPCDVEEQSLSDKVCNQLQSVFPQETFLKKQVDLLEDNPDAPCGDVKKEVDALSLLALDASFAEKYLLSNPKFMEELLAKYLKQIYTPFAPNVMGGRGTFGLAKQSNPSTIEEAGFLAGKLFDR